MTLKLITRASLIAAAMAIGSTEAWALERGGSRVSKAVVRGEEIYCDGILITQDWFREVVVATERKTSGISMFNLRQGSMKASEIRVKNMSWGIAEDRIYLVRHDEFGSIGQTAISVPVVPLDLWRTANNAEGDPKARMNAMGEIGDSPRTAVVEPTALLFTILENADVLRENWKVYYDVNFVSSERMDVIYAYQGELCWATVIPEGYLPPAEFEDRASTETVIDCAFRALRSGDRLILIDEKGRVFSSPRDGHAQIGQIANWPTDEETDRDVYLLEDATTHELRIVEVVDEKGDGNDGEGGKRIVRSLEFDEDQDNTHGNPFTADLPSDEVQQALIRLTEAIEEGDDKGGGGDGG